MTELRYRRVRAHVPPGPSAGPRPWWTPPPDQAALLVHVLADERDRLILAGSRELISTPSGPLTISERLYAPAQDVDARRSQTGELSPDVPVGLAGGALPVDAVEVLGRLVCRRSYLQRWPVVAWDPEWTLGRLAAHTGPARGRRDGFAVRLAGTGISVDGRWSPSWHYPTLLMLPAGGGAAGAFLSWKPPRHEAARTRRPGQQAEFLSLQSLSSAIVGGEFDEPLLACEWLGLDWPAQPDDPVSRLRAETHALARLFERVMAGLMRVAPGLDPARVRSFGSLADHALRTAGVTAPLGKAGDGPAG